MNNSFEFDSCEQYQNEKSQYIVTQDEIINSQDIRYIGGLDISFKNNDNFIACAFLSIFDLHTNKIIYEDHHLCTLDIPYASGFLGIRETPEYKKLLTKIIDQPFYPQVVLVDGFGILHHRGFGSASQLGYEMNIPTIGVGKTLLSIDGLSEFTLKEQFRQHCKSKGDFINLIGKTGKHYGIALQSSEGITNPIFVSIGHKISIETSREIVLKTCIFSKIPEPIRNSDKKSRTIILNTY